MKKLILVLILVVAGAVAAEPYIAGTVLQQRLEKTQTLPGLPNDMVWHIDGFKRGYLHSTATSTLTLSNIGGKSYVLHFNHRIDQVPGMDGSYATVHTEWVPKNGEIKDALTKLFGDQAVFSMDTHMLLTGGTSSTGKVPVIDKPGVQFSGTNLVFNTTADRHFSYHADADKLMLEPTKWPDSKAKLDGKLVVQGLSLKAKGQIGEDGIVWDSEGKMGIQQMQMLGLPEGDVDVEGFGAGFNTTRKGDDVSLMVDYGAKHIQAPTTTIKKAEIRMLVSKLSADALMSMQKQIQEVQQQSTGNPELDQKRILGAMMMQLPALIDHGMKIEWNPIKAELKQGEVVVHLFADLPPHAMSSALGASGQQGSPLAMLQYLTVKGDVTLPKALLVKQENLSGQPSLEQRLAPLVQKGYITEKNGQIHSSMVFSKGHLTVNGVPADDLLAAMIAARQHRAAP